MGVIGHNQKKRSLTSLTNGEKEKLKGVVKELNDSLTRVASERDFQKDAINTAAEEIGLDKKLVRKLAKVYFTATYDQEVDDQNEFRDYYDNLFRTKTS
jgi:Transcriptional regulator DsbA